MDPIEKIIDKLKKEHGENGSYYVLETQYKEDFTNNSMKGKEETYNIIYGFIFGLYATNFITEKKREAAIKYLIEVMYKI